MSRSRTMKNQRYQHIYYSSKKEPNQESNPLKGIKLSCIGFNWQLFFYDLENYSGELVAW